MGRRCAEGALAQAVGPIGLNSSLKDRRPRPRPDRPATRQSQLQRSRYRPATTPPTFRSGTPGAPGGSRIRPRASSTGPYATRFCGQTDDLPLDLLRIFGFSTRGLLTDVVRQLPLVPAPDGRQVGTADKHDNDSYLGCQLGRLWSARVDSRSPRAQTVEVPKCQPNVNASLSAPSL